ncbi:hypothetical protein IQ24_00380 [Paracoccus sulfuroxidans]|uniref:VRR-NUC domain-containing protein n=1 Tax=Paracoccus sulfuroxidans TaxID=384678 RepID=A0A562P184_9RHOB|nr:hypothetical protein IQ24_00380 [Paracoccus sulfuroxidans]
MRESEIQSRILVALCAGFVGRSLFMRINSGKIRNEDRRWIQLAPPGTADILGTIDGRSVAIECKAARGAQRETQKRFQAAFEKAGGVYIISKDPDRVCEDLKNEMKRNETVA